MNKKTLITLLIAIVSILMITFFVRDWLVFYKCGAVEQCLVENSNYQNIAKFAVTTIMTIVFHWQELPLHTRPQLFTSGFRDGFVCRFLPENHAQLRKHPRAP